MQGIVPTFHTFKTYSELQVQSWPSAENQDWCHSKHQLYNTDCHTAVPTEDHMSLKKQEKVNENTVGMFPFLLSICGTQESFLFFSKTPGIVNSGNF